MVITIAASALTGEPSVAAIETAVSAEKIELVRLTVEIAMAIGNFDFAGGSECSASSCAGADGAAARALQGALASTVRGVPAYGFAVDIVSSAGT